MYSSSFDQNISWSRGQNTRDAPPNLFSWMHRDSHLLAHKSNWFTCLSDCCYFSLFVASVCYLHFQTGIVEHSSAVLYVPTCQVWAENIATSVNSYVRHLSFFQEPSILWLHNQSFTTFHCTIPMALCSNISVTLVSIEKIGQQLSS